MVGHAVQLIIPGPRDCAAKFIFCKKELVNPNPNPRATSWCILFHFELVGDINNKFDSNNERVKYNPSRASSCVILEYMMSAIDEGLESVQIVEMSNIVKMNTVQLNRESSSKRGYLDT